MASVNDINPIVNLRNPTSPANRRLYLLVYI